MPFNVPEDKKPEFNQKVKGSLELLTSGVDKKLGEFRNLQPETLVDAYNQPNQAPVTRDLTPLEQYVYQPQPVQKVADLTAKPVKENMVAVQEQPKLGLTKLSNTSKKDRSVSLETN